VGHVAYKEEKIIAYKISAYRSEGKRLLERSRHRCETTKNGF
jgi:hypothetical protein